MVRIENDYLDIGSKTNKTSVNIDISDRESYPDGNYDIKVKFDENDYYYSSEATLSPIQGEKFSTSYTKINYSLDNENYSNISDTELNGKYYDDTVLYLKLKYQDNDNEYKGNYTLDINIFNVSDNSLVKTYNITGNYLNIPKISDLYLLEVGRYKIDISFNSPENSRIVGCNHTLYYNQSKNKIIFYNFEKQGDNGVYDDNSNRELNTYIDQLDTVRQQLRTEYGNRSIPNNIEIDILENNNVIQTVKTFKDNMADASLIGDTNGCILYIPQFTNGTPNNIEVSTVLNMLDENQEYIIQMNKNTYNITIGNYIKLEINSTSQKITIDYNSLNNDKLVFNKTLSISDDHKIYITKHGNIFRIIAISGMDNENNVLLSIPKKFVSGDIILSVDPIKIDKYNLKSLTSSNNKIYSTEYTFNIKNNNFENTSKLIINKLELEYDDSYDYLVDGYHNDKVINYFSTISFDYKPKTSDTGVKIGYSVNDIQMDNVQSFVIKNRIPNLTLNKDYYIKFYIEKHHYCMYMIQIQRKIFPIDWKITTSQDSLSEPNINLSITDMNNNEIKEPIKPNTLFNINCNTALENKSIKILRKKDDGQYNVIYSGITGEDGKFNKTGIMDTAEGTSYYKAQLTTYDNKIVESDIDYPITIFYSDTIITFNAFTKTNFNLNETITLTTVAKRNINGNYQNISESMDVKYYIILYDDIRDYSEMVELGSKTIDSNGQSSFIFNLSDLKNGNYLISDRIRFRAELIGNEDYNSASVESDFITINKDNYNVTLSAIDSSVWGKNVTLRATVVDEDSNPIPNVDVQFTDYDGEFIGWQKTNSSGICSETVLLPGIDQNKKPGVYTYRVVAVPNDNYSIGSEATKSINVIKRDVILTPIANHVKSLIEGGDVPSEGIDTLFWDWQQRFKIIDTEGEIIKGNPVLHILANGINYDKTPNSNGIVGLNIHWHAHDGKGGKIFTETITCTYDGNDWYNGKILDKTFDYKLNDAVYASPNTVTQSNSSGNIDWDSQYLNSYNLRWDTIKGIKYLQDGTIKDNDSDFYLMSNVMTTKSEQPKTLNLSNWNVDSPYSFNYSLNNFKYDSHIIAMYYIIEDKPYKTNTDKNYAQINNIDFSFGNNLPSFSTNIRYINQSFEDWGYRAFLYWENREQDEQGNYKWLDEGENLRVWTSDSSWVQNNNFTPDKFNQVRLLNNDMVNTIKYGINEIDNASSVQLLRRVFFVVAFIPKQVNINLSDYILTTNNLTKKFGDSEQFTATVTDIQGNPIKNDTVIFKVNGVEYERKTDAEGKARLNINLNPDVYTVYTKYMDSNGYVVENTNTIRVNE